MDFAAHLAEARRLALLQGLQHSAQYTANASLLRRYAESLGFTCSAAQVETDIAWLGEQGLVDRKAGTHTVATLKQRGLDVATGAAVTPGVARPEPT